MKKLLFLLVGMMIFLAACEDGDAGAENEEPEDNESELTEEEETEDVSTDDPLAFADKTDENAKVLIDGMNEYVIESYYVSDDTDEQGFNTYEDGEFLMRYAIVETENIAEAEVQGERRLMILGEIINNTDQDYHFDKNRFFIKTDENEESSLSFDLNGAWRANQKSKFIDDFPLEYDIPEAFALTIIDPSLEGDGDDAVFGDDWGRKFDEAFEEFKEEHLIVELEFHRE
ncbi:hypothetical protein BN997_01069 [Oceanobacillus oncorhynchi]|uniref:Telomeric repeat-binding factor 2 n=1 Tax=Oceanobacillus oncorhynchi TaxID=545501 RepID=A0A0A1MQC1_9BACI|nr:hypothetical protein [Oceanobacillus oncorhynchi]CEI81251.1 hypothetical protein BN997_01069 [Oceanobacillus oncorhynchi]